MSIKNLPYNQNKLVLQDFECNNSFTIREAINNVSHYVDEATGKYVIADKSNPILSVNMDGTLNSCHVKSHVTSVVAPLSSQVGVHQSSIDDHESRLGDIESNVGSSDLTALTNRVAELEAYIVSLKGFMAQFQAGFIVTDDLDFDPVL